MKPQLPDGGQESLLVVGQQSGQFEARDFTIDTESPERAISLVERNLHLQNVLSMFARVSQLDGLGRAMHTPHQADINERYKGAADQVAERALAHINKPVLLAKWEFARAFGLFDIEEVVDTSTAKSMALEGFSNFHRQFGPAHRVHERNAMQLKLERNTKQLQDNVTLTNRQAGLRPHQSSSHAAEKEIPKLTTQQRLQAILSDVRAGFIPTTNTEKNVVLSFLDYLDNPQYPIGVNNQLYEVYRNRANSTHSQVEGERAMRSITYELADFYQDASRQLTALTNLCGVIHNCPNPFVSLAEEIGNQHPGYAPLIRFLDLNELIRTGTVEGVGGWRSVLKTYENREGHSLRYKRKTIEDPYTRVQPEAPLVERIATKPHELMIGPMRKAVAQAIADQEKRFYFMHQRLTETAEQSGERRDFEQVRQISRMVLHEVA